MDRQQKLSHRLRPRNLLRTLIAALPKTLRHPVYRSMVRLTDTPPPGLVIKVATTQDELAQAFRVLHDEYVRAGYMEVHPSGMRLTPYHALPTTTTLVAKFGDEVAATVSIIKDSAFGFPLEGVFDTRPLRGMGTRLAEISSLAVKRSHRQNSGAMLFPLLKYLYQYCIRYLGVDYMLIAVHPAHFEFYEALLDFNRIGEVNTYGFAGGLPAAGGFLDLRSAYVRFAAFYGRKPDTSNIFRYFTALELECCRYPDRRFNKSQDPVMTPEMLDYFFNRQSGVFNALGGRERAILRSLYNDPAYDSVLPPTLFDTDEHNARREPRYDVQCEGRLVLSPSRIVKMKVLDASALGFQARLAEPIRFGTEIVANVAVADFEIADLKCFPVWSRDNLVFGFTVTASSPNWTHFVEHLKADVTRTPGGSAPAA